MIDISKLESIINKVPSFILSKDIKNDILENSKILYEFNDFLCEKYNISPQEAENRLKSFLENKSIINPNPDIRTIIGWTIEFVKSENFQKSSEFESAFVYLIKILGPIANITKPI